MKYYRIYSQNTETGVVTKGDIVYEGDLAMHWLDWNTKHPLKGQYEYWLEEATELEYTQNRLNNATLDKR